MMVAIAANIDICYCHGGDCCKYWHLLLWWWRLLRILIFATLMVVIVANKLRCTLCHLKNHYSSKSYIKHYLSNCHHLRNCIIFFLKNLHTYDIYYYDGGNCWKYWHFLIWWWWLLQVLTFAAMMLAIVANIYFCYYDGGDCCKYWHLVIWWWWLLQILQDISYFICKSS